MFLLQQEHIKKQNSHEENEIDCMWNNNTANINKLCRNHDNDQKGREGTADSHKENNKNYTGSSNIFI